MPSASAHPRSHPHAMAAAIGPDGSQGIVDGDRLARQAEPQHVVGCVMTSTPSPPTYECTTRRAPRSPPLAAKCRDAAGQRRRCRGHREFFGHTGQREERVSAQPARRAASTDPWVSASSSRGIAAPYSPAGPGPPDLEPLPPRQGRRQPGRADASPRGYRTGQRDEHLGLLLAIGKEAGSRSSRPRGSRVGCTWIDRGVRPRAASPRACRRARPTHPAGTPCQAAMTVVGPRDGCRTTPRPGDDRCLTPLGQAINGAPSRSPSVRPRRCAASVDRGTASSRSMTGMPSRTETLVHTTCTRGVADASTRAERAPRMGRRDLQQDGSRPRVSAQQSSLGADDGEHLVANASMVPPSTASTFSRSSGSVLLGLRLNHQSAPDTVMPSRSSKVTPDRSAEGAPHPRARCDGIIDHGIDLPAGDIPVKLRQQARQGGPRRRGPSAARTCIAASMPESARQKSVK